MSQTAVMKKAKKSASCQDEVPSSAIKTVSLFAGCGGLDLGFLGGFSFKNTRYKKNPISLLAAYDNDARCVETYTQNIGPHIHQADLSVHKPDKMPAAELLIGGFPCQDFSSCGPQHGLESHRGRLYKAFVKYMKFHQPSVVVAENVINLKRMQGGEVLKKILRDLEATGYRFEVWTLFAPDFGIPQRRTRLFLVGVREDLPGFVMPPMPTHEKNHRSIDWAIGDLENTLDESVPNQSQYFLASKAKKGNGQGDEVSRVGEPSYTVRANAKSRVQFHYKLERRLTVRECARLQTFPDTFYFPHSGTSNIMQIGNAVPPVLGHQVAQAVLAYFQQLEEAPKVNAGLLVKQFA